MSESVTPRPDLGFHYSAVALVLAWFHGVHLLLLERQIEEPFRHLQRFVQQRLGNAMIDHLKVTIWFVITVERSGLEVLICVALVAC